MHDLGLKTSIQTFDAFVRSTLMENQPWPQFQNGIRERSIYVVLKALARLQNHAQRQQRHSVFNRIISQVDVAIKMKLLNSMPSQGNVCTIAIEYFTT